MELPLPPSWSRVEFVSDVHLQVQERDTQQAFARYLRQCSADALFILGDLFEVWVGDDTLDQATPFEQEVLDMLRQASARRPVFYMVGNRDFLAGKRLLQHTGMQPLPDPCTLVHARQRIVLSHGDALCTHDSAYQAFRQQTRTPAWQQAFLRQPLAQRRALAAQMRQASQTHQEAQRAQGQDYAEVDADAALALLQQCRAQTLVHGHTHRAATHALGPQHARWVLSDWDARSTPARLQALQWDLRAPQPAQAALRRVDLPPGTGTAPTPP
ncbi:MAG: UDP-2,3-diacylglucosamine diphosphatase [Rhodoferax sp.]